MNMEVEIIEMNPEHWEEVAKIYLEGIETGMATFEKQIPNWADWDKNHLKACRIVGLLNSKAVGWAALSAVSSRCVYGGVGEVSVYVSQNYRGYKIGEILLRKLIYLSEQNGLWTIQSGIFPENISSIKLHEKVGFRRIGYREKIGKLDGIWKDNIILERRSNLVGID